MLSRDEILSKVALKRENVSVPEWGGDVIVCEMSGSERDAWEQSVNKTDKNGNIRHARAKLVAATIVGEDGQKIFSDPDDLEEIGRLSSIALDRICKLAQRLNGLTSESLEEAEGNS